MHARQTTSIVLFVVVIIAVGLFLGIADDSDEVKSVSQHVSTAKFLQKNADLPAHGPGASPFEACSPIGTCSASSDVEQDDLILPVRTQFQVYLQALQSGDFASINLMHELITSCFKTHSAALLIAEYVSSQLNKDVVECDHDEATEIINKINFEFTKKVASVFDSTEADNLRTYWLVTQRSMYDSIKIQDELKVERIGSTITIRFSNSSLENASP